MTLREWLLTSGQTQAAAAARCGVHQVTFSRWVTGHAIPRRKCMARIVRVTDGAVTGRDFFPDMRPPPEEAA